ncbi:hypothetical protein BJ742DRAFT_218703 [Cladochytrium replicatum]|nr:hypothetical protein BJ742DRAFT_218703 [Cladochytrium replicatum]
MDGIVASPSSEGDDIVTVMLSYVPVPSPSDGDASLRPTQEQLTQYDSMNRRFRPIQQARMKTNLAQWSTQLKGLYRANPQWVPERVLREHGWSGTDRSKVAVVFSKEAALADIPAGYAMFEYVKFAERPISIHHEPPSSERKDLYIFGHPMNRKYKSVPEFTPHLLWMAQTPSLDHSSCLCKYCNPGPARTPKRDTPAISTPQKKSSKMSIPQNPKMGTVANAAEQADDPTVRADARRKTYSGSGIEPQAQSRRLSDLGTQRPSAIERQMSNLSNSERHNNRSVSNFMVISDESSEETVEGPVKITPAGVSPINNTSNAENKRRVEIENATPSKRAKTTHSSPQKTDEDSDIIWITSDDSNVSTPKTNQKAVRNESTRPTPKSGSQFHTSNAKSSANRETKHLHPGSAIPSGPQTAAKHSSEGFPHDYQSSDGRTNISGIDSTNAPAPSAGNGNHRNNDGGALQRHSLPQQNVQHYIPSQHASNSAVAANRLNMSIASNTKNGGLSVANRESGIISLLPLTGATSVPQPPQRINNGSSIHVAQPQPRPTSAVAEKRDARDMSPKSLLMYLLPAPQSNKPAAPPPAFLSKAPEYLVGKLENFNPGEIVWMPCCLSPRDGPTVIKFLDVLHWYVPNSSAPNVQIDPNTRMTTMNLNMFRKGWVRWPAVVTHTHIPTPLLKKHIWTSPIVMSTQSTESTTVVDFSTLHAFSYSELGDGSHAGWRKLMAAENPVVLAEIEALMLCPTTPGEGFSRAYTVALLPTQCYVKITVPDMDVEPYAAYCPPEETTLWSLAMDHRTVHEAATSHGFVVKSDSKPENVATKSMSSLLHQRLEHIQNDLEKIGDVQLATYYSALASCVFRLRSIGLRHPSFKDGRLPSGETQLKHFRFGPDVIAIGDVVRVARNCGKRVILHGEQKASGPPHHMYTTIFKNRLENYLTSITGKNALPPVTPEQLIEEFLKHERIQEYHREMLLKVARDIIILKLVGHQDEKFKNLDDLVFDAVEKQYKYQSKHRKTPVPFTRPDEELLRVTGITLTCPAPTNSPPDGSIVLTPKIQIIGTRLRIVVLPPVDKCSLPPWCKESDVICGMPLPERVPLYRTFGPGSAPVVLSNDPFWVEYNLNEGAERMPWKDRGVSRNVGGYLLGSIDQEQWKWQIGLEDLRGRFRPMYPDADAVQMGMEFVDASDAEGF